jgi:hypothetical protein
VDRADPAILESPGWAVSAPRRAVHGRSMSRSTLPRYCCGIDLISDTFSWMMAPMEPRAIRTSSAMNWGVFNFEVLDADSQGDRTGVFFYNRDDPLGALGALDTVRKKWHPLKVRPNGHTHLIGDNAPDTLSRRKGNAKT